MKEFSDIKTDLHCELKESNKHWNKLMAEVNRLENRCEVIERALDIACGKNSESFYCDWQNIKVVAIEVAKKELERTEE